MFGSYCSVKHVETFLYIMILKVYQCRFEYLPIRSNSCKNNTLKISHS